MKDNKNNSGFTLIEMSIVLVIIGLIVGGILVGVDMVNAAAIRAQISQIEKYNTAVHTFQSKYGYLPGDIPNPYASQFGFQSRGNYPGTGDGNGILQGFDPGDGYANGLFENGETTMFWVDLSTANLIDGTFNTASGYTMPLSTVTAATTPSLNNYFPTAKIGNSNNVIVWSGGLNYYSTAHNTGDSINYFAVTGISAMTNQHAYLISPSFMSITVAQAYAIDSKIDDGYPMTGKVLAVGPRWYNSSLAGQGANSAPSTAATPGSTTTCFDNSSASGGTPGVTGATQHYSLEMSSGANVNCVLSFSFQ